jgi:Ca-activated chloride channel family protein
LRVRKQSTIAAYLLLLILLALVLGGLWYWANEISGGEVLLFRMPAALVLCGGAVLVAVVGLHWQMPRRASFWFSQTAELGTQRLGWVSRLARLPTVLRIIALLLIAIALARPQTHTEEARTVEGIDIMFVLDLSKSMEEEDLQRNRLDAGQRTIREFLRKRQGRGDRIGLVVFAKEAMLQCPLTLDYQSLESVVAGLRIGEVPELGTAIGDALGLALASLRRSESASKVVILLSDGDWNKAPYMDPYEARDLGVKMGVRVFTVLLGQEDSGQARGLGQTRSQYAVNPLVLKEIAADTGGEFFNAGDDAQLSATFDEIRKSLTKSENRIVGSSLHLELYGLLVWPAFLLLLLELLLRMTRFRSFP